VITIGIVINERCQASSVFAVTDLLIAANFTLQRYFATPAPLSNYQLIGLKSNTRAYNGSQIGPAVKIQNCERPDIVILPGAFESVLTPSHAQKLLTKMSRLFPTLKAWHQAGTTIASVCTGNFIVASANISDGRTLTCHWASEKTAGQLFPSE